MKKEKLAGTEKEIEIVYGERCVRGDLHLPETAGKCPAVILSHGYNGCKANFAKECAFFTAHGFLTLAIDFCGGSSCSTSSGSSTEMSLRTETEDLLAVLDYVRNMPEADPDRVILFGASQGGIVSALAAGQREKEVRGLVLYYPAFCIPDDWRRRYPDGTQIPETEVFWGLPLGSVYARDAITLEPYTLAGRYRRDALIIHGDEDDVVPLSYSLQLQKTYEKAQLLILPQEKHGFTPDGGAKAAEYALRFMRRLCMK